MLRRPKLGLVLGGGGARGLAHIGVLKILEQNKIPIDIISGSSAGALIGALYALNPNINEIEAKIHTFFNSPEFKKTKIEQIVKNKDAENFLSQVATYLKEKIVINLAHSRTSLVNNRRFKTMMSRIIPNANFDDTKILFAAVASDLITGRDILIKEGNLLDAIIASSSIPGFLPPVNNCEYILMDGCITQPIPVKAAFELGADVVVAVDVTPNLFIKNKFENIFEIITRTNHITANAYNSIQAENANLVIRPNIGHYHWSEFSKIDEIIHEGEKAALRLIAKIKRLTTRQYFLLRQMNLR